MGKDLNIELFTDHFSGMGYLIRTRQSLIISGKDFKIIYIFHGKDSCYMMFKQNGITIQIDEVNLS